MSCIFSFIFTSLTSYTQEQDKLTSSSQQAVEILRSENRQMKQVNETLKENCQTTQAEVKLLQRTKNNLEIELAAAQDELKQAKVSFLEEKKFLQGCIQENQAKESQTTGQLKVWQEKAGAFQQSTNKLQKLLLNASREQTSTIR